MNHSSGLSKQIYNTFKTSLNLLGIVVTDDNNCKLRPIQPLIMCSIFSSCFVLSCVGMSDTSDDLEAFISRVTEACSTAFSLCMTCLIVINKDRICRVFAILHQGIVRHDRLLTEHQKKLKETGHNVSKVIVFTMVYAISIATVVRLVFPFLFGYYTLYNGVEEGVNLPLPLAIWRPIASDTVLKYTALYLYATVCVLGMSALFQCLAAILFTSIIYARYEIKILANVLLLGEQIVGEENLSLDCLEDSIQHHQQLLSFIRLLNETFGMTTFFMVELIGVLICLDVYQMSVDKSLFSSSSLSLSGTVLASFIVLWMISWFGQSLIDEDNRLRAAMYNGEWVNKSNKHKRHILLMLQRSNRPMCIKIAGLQTLDYSTFLSIIQVAYSYYNILHSVQSKKYT